MSDSGTPGRRRKRRKRKGKRPIGRAREIVKEISDILKQVKLFVDDRIQDHSVDRLNFHSEMVSNLRVSEIRSI